MNENERYYRGVMGAIGGTMLVFWGLFIADSFLITVVSALTYLFPMSPVAAEIIYQILYAIGYLLVFMLPALFFKRFLLRAGLPYQPFEAPFKFPPSFALILFAGIAVILSAAYFNASLVSVFQYSQFSSDMLWGEIEYMEGYQIVLQLLTVAVVPGFCEEFLFRGIILPACRPFGRFRAILISALLFSLMHQNAEQIFYAFVAGILLGLVYERTGSLWACVVLHMLNNAVSVMEGVIYSNLGDDVAASLWVTLLETVLILLGVISLAILICRAFSKRPSLQDGVFEQTLPSADFYEPCPVSPQRAFSLFWTPTMIAFFVISGIQILSLVGMAVLYAILL